MRLKQAQNENMLLLGIEGVTFAVVRHIASIYEARISLKASSIE